jgi:hypothetical protein
MKRWRREWKIELVEKHNPTWRDLFADVLRDAGFERRLRRLRVNRVVSRPCP